MGRFSSRCDDGGRARNTKVWNGPTPRARVSAFALVRPRRFAQLRGIRYRRTNLPYNGDMATKPRAPKWCCLSSVASGQPCQCEMTRALSCRRASHQGKWEAFQGSTRHRPRCFMQCRWPSGLSRHHPIADFEIHPPIRVCVKGLPANSLLCRTVDDDLVQASLPVGDAFARTAEEELVGPPGCDSYSFGFDLGRRVTVQVNPNR
jgi:hypothetical protein